MSKKYYEMTKEDMDEQNRKVKEAQAKKEEFEEAQARQEKVEKIITRGLAILIALLLAYVLYQYAVGKLILVSCLLI